MVAKDFIWGPALPHFYLVSTMKKSIEQRRNHWHWSFGRLTVTATTTSGLMYELAADLSAWADLAAVEGVKLKLKG